MHSLVDRGARDARRREANALVDHVHARVAGAHGDLLGAVRMAVQARLANQDLHPAPEALGHPLDAVAERGQRIVGRRGHRVADPGRRAVLAEHRSQGRGPLARGGPGGGGRERRGHQIGFGIDGRLAELLERLVHRFRVASRAPGGQRVDARALHCRIDAQDPAVLARPEAARARPRCRCSGPPREAPRPRSGACARGATPRAGSSCRARPPPRRRARPLPPSPRSRPTPAPRPGPPSPSTPRRCRDIRAGRFHRRGSAGCAATTADPRAVAGRAPRSRPAAAAPAPEPSGPWSRRAPPARSG